MHKVADMDMAGETNIITKNSDVWTGLTPMVTGKATGMTTDTKEGMAGLPIARRRYIVQDTTGGITARLL
jgi:hypothetical protein